MTAIGRIAKKKRVFWRVRFRPMDIDDPLSRLGGETDDENDDNNPGDSITGQ